VLAGGVANAGAVTRVGDEVLRPSNPHSPSIHRFLAALVDAGYRGASVPVGMNHDGRERLAYIPGDVAIAPYPSWVQADTALASIAVLMRGFHEASRHFDAADSTWSDEMADPRGGSIVCHNDVCLENVVFRDGVAAGLLDFDFAAPGRPVYDLAACARMCVPIDDDVSAGRLGWERADRVARLRLFADAYGLDRGDSQELVESIGASIASGGVFLRRRIAAGDSNFVSMWNEIGGMERFDRRRRWWAEHNERFLNAIT